jgi:hypothetical protein
MQLPVRLTKENLVLFLFSKIKMRDKRFIAEHRGGSLTKDQHKLLIIWACACVENVMSLLREDKDERLTQAVNLAKEWSRGEASVGDARKASLKALEVANEFSDPIIVAVARAAGHAVATAHMADHSLRAAFYALKAVENEGRSAEAEKKWQNEQLPAEIMDMVLTASRRKEIFINSHHFTVIL